METIQNNNARHIQLVLLDAAEFSYPMGKWLPSGNWGKQRQPKRSGVGWLENLAPTQLAFAGE